MSNSVQPHRWQPTRLPHPWDSPGKNTGVDCHFLLQCMKVKSESEVSQSCPTQRPHGLQPTRLLHPWDFPGKITGVGCHCLLRNMLSRLGITFLLWAVSKIAWQKPKSYHFFLTLPCWHVPGSPGCVFFLTVTCQWTSFVQSQVSGALELTALTLLHHEVIDEETGLRENKSLIIQL